MATYGFCAPCFLAQDTSTPTFLQRLKIAMNPMSLNKEEISEQIRHMLMETSAENTALRKLLTSMHLSENEKNQMNTGKEYPTNQNVKK